MLMCAKLLSLSHSHLYKYTLTASHDYTQKKKSTGTLTVMHYSDELGLYTVVCCAPRTCTVGMEQLDPPIHGADTAHSHSDDAAYTVCHWM